MFEVWCTSKMEKYRLQSSFPYSAEKLEHFTGWLSHRPDLGLLHTSQRLGELSNRVGLNLDWWEGHHLPTILFGGYFILSRYRRKSWNDTLFPTYIHLWQIILSLFEFCTELCFRLLCVFSLALTIPASGDWIWSPSRTPGVQRNSRALLSRTKHWLFESISMSSLAVVDLVCNNSDQHLIL